MMMRLVCLSLALLSACKPTSREDAADDPAPAPERPGSQDSADSDDAPATRSDPGTAPGVPDRSDEVATPATGPKPGEASLAPLVHLTVLFAEGAGDAKTLVRAAGKVSDPFWTRRVLPVPKEQLLTGRAALTSDGTRQTIGYPFAENGDVARGGLGLLTLANGADAKQALPHVPTWPAVSGRQLALARSPDGAVHALHLGGDPVGTELFHTRIDSTGNAFTRTVETFAAETPIGEADLAVDGSGRLHVAYVQAGAARYRVAEHGGAFGPSSQIDAECRAVGLKLAVTDAGEVGVALTCDDVEPPACQLHLVHGSGVAWYARSVATIDPGSACLPFHSARPALASVPEGWKIAYRQTDAEHAGQWSIALVEVDRSGRVVANQELAEWTVTTGFPVLSSDVGGRVYLAYARGGEIRVAEWGKTPLATEATALKFARTAPPVMEVLGVAVAREPLDDKEGFDPRNRPRNFGLPMTSYEETIRREATEGQLSHKPWTDSYWPYTKKNVARRYVTGAEFASFADQIADLASRPGDATLSPAEKYDLLVENESRALTAQSWAVYDFYDDRYFGQPALWEWMGICHGWAPASMLDQAPQQHVLATNAAGRRILFFEGDLRALLSKAYDLNKMSEGTRAIGSRCETKEDELVRDEHGRVADVVVEGSGETFRIFEDEAATSGILGVERAGLRSWLRLSAPARNLTGKHAAKRYENRADAVAASNAGEDLRIVLYKACRDLNPGAMHAALVHGLSDGVETKLAMAVELSRASEVWNHPVWGYVSDVGRPRALAAEPAARRHVASPRASYLADVLTRLVYVGGSEPRMRHGDNLTSRINYGTVRHGLGYYMTLDLKYTLELDAAGQVVGGEWTSEGNHPDFLWRAVGELTDKPKRGESAIISYALLKKLVGCSTRPADAQVVVDTGNGPTNVAAASCDLSR